jgi:hypothetical protein
VFGLHANADISYYTSDTRALWGDLVDLQPRVGAAAGAMSREEFVAGIVRDISAKIPEQFDLPLLAKGLGVPSPTQVVLLQELARWNGVLEAMNSSLQDLQRALSGGVASGASMYVWHTPQPARMRYTLPVRILHMLCAYIQLSVPARHITHLLAASELLRYHRLC